MQGLEPWVLLPLMRPFLVNVRSHRGLKALKLDINYNKKCEE